MEKHAPDTWRRNVALAYEAVARLDVLPVLGDSNRSTGTFDILVDRVMAETGYSPGMSGAIRENLSLLPFGLRLKSWMKLRQASVAPSPRWLLPEWIIAQGVRLHRRLYTATNAN